MLAVGHAHAQSSAQAEALFEQGKTSMRERRFAEACNAFESSQRIEPAVTTLLNLADCREKHGELATAWGAFIEVERQTRGKPEQASLHEVAIKRAAALEPRLSKLTIRVASPLDGLAVTRDGAAVDRSTWTFALPVDGGTYTIAAQAPGHVAWQTRVVVAREGSAAVVDVPVLAVVVPAPPPSKLPAIAVGAGALVLGGIALGFELSARSVYRDATAETENARQTSLWDAANRRRHVAQGFGIAAVAATGVAVYLYLRTRHGSATRTAVVPVVAPASAGLAFTGAW